MEAIAVPGEKRQAAGFWFPGNHSFARRIKTGAKLNGAIPAVIQQQFPHGKDQWISAAGTTWTVLALLNTIEARPSRTDRAGLDY